MVNTSNTKNLEAWLEDIPRKSVVAFANRAATRTLPVATMHATENKSVGLSEHTSYLLSCFRCMLITGVASTWPTPVMSKKIRTATSNSSISSRAVASASRAASYAASRAALAAADAAAYTASTASASAALASSDISIVQAVSNVFRTASPSADAAASATVDAAASDAEQLDKNEDTSALWTRKLWPTTSIPYLLAEGWDRFKSVATGTEWEFWAEWYQGILDGNPMDWDLQREVALIPNEDWEIGARHIAYLIEVIRKKLHLRQQIASLETELDKLEQPIAGIGDNRPPEEETVVSSPVSDFTLTAKIRRTLRELKEELLETVPFAPKIQDFIEELGNEIDQLLWKLTELGLATQSAISTTAEAFGKYTVKKTDVAIDESIKVSIKSTGLYITAEAIGVREVAEDLISAIGKLIY